MDPQVTWKELIAAYIEHDWDIVQESADALLLWLDQDGFPPETAPELRLGRDWNRAVVQAACQYASDLARQVLHSENGIPAGVPFSLSCYSCDASGPDSYEAALTEGWSEIEFAPAAASENFFGDCPECANSAESQVITTTNKENKDMANDKKRPVHEVRVGRIRAAIWENETEKGVRHNLTISRLYKDGDHWKDTTSFGRDDLLLIGKVADQAHSWIYDQGNGSQESDNGGDEPF